MVRSYCSKLFTVPVRSFCSSLFLKDWTVLEFKRNNEWLFHLNHDMFLSFVSFRSWSNLNETRTVQNRRLIFWTVRVSFWSFSSLFKEHLDHLNHFLHSMNNLYYILWNYMKFHVSFLVHKINSYSQWIKIKSIILLIRSIEKNRLWMTQI